MQVCVWVTLQRVKVDKEKKKRIQVQAEDYDTNTEIYKTVSEMTLPKNEEREFLKNEGDVLKIFCLRGSRGSG